MRQGILFDIMLLVLLLIGAYIGSCTGFVRAVFACIRLSASYMGALFLTKLLSPAISLAVFLPGVSKKLAQAAQTSSALFSTVQDGLSLAGQKTQAAVDALSAFYRDAGFPRVLADNFAYKSAFSAHADESLLESLSKIVAENIASILVFLIFFVIILIMLRLLTNWLRGLIRFLVPKCLNSALGLVFGALCAATGVFFLLRFLGETMPALFLPGHFLDATVLCDTYLVKYFMEANYPEFLTYFLSGGQ